MGRRTYQIHPTVRCNLRCLHCYSSSGPERTSTLPSETVIRSIEAAADEGYDALAVSGGEPLLYRSLPAVLDCAARHGMLRSLTTNGTLVCARTIEMLAGRADFVAISVDGLRDAHDHLRARRGAFDAVERAADLLRRAGIAFGFIYTLTRANVHQMPEVVAWAAERGAALLQIHPLEAAGRATSEVPELAPTARDAAIAYLLAAGSANGSLRVHFDMADRESLLDSEPPRGDRLADLVSPLVLEEDGTVVPLQHGFPRAFAVGNVGHEDLRALSQRWARSTYPRFRKVREAVTRRARAEATPLPFFNWYESMAMTANATITC